MIKDELTKQVLYELNLSGYKSINEISKSLKVKPHRVQYALEKLKNTHKLKIIPFVDFSRLGMCSYLIFFSLNSTSCVSKVINDLMQHSKVGWVGTLAGNYQYGCAFLANHIQEVYQFFVELSDKHGDVIVNKQISPRIKFYWFGRRYLSVKKELLKYFSFSSGMETIEIDGLDRKILLALGNHLNQPLAIIAKQLGEPYPTIARRVANLEKRQVLTGYFASLAPEELGREAYRVRIKTNTSSSKVRDMLLEFIKKELTVTYFVESLSSWEYELGLELEQAKEYVRFSQALMRAMSPYHVELEIMNELEDLKWSFYPGSSVLKM